MAYVIGIIVIILGAGAFMFWQNTSDEVVAPAAPEPIARPVDETEDTDRVVTETEDDTEPAPAMAETEPSTDTVVAEPEPAIVDTPATAVATGANGTFTGNASYSTGRQVHELEVTLELEDDIVVAADIVYDGEDEPSTGSLSRFDAAYEAEVIGKDIDTIELSRVGGASWTSDAFNEALATIKNQAG